MSKLQLEKMGKHYISFWQWTIPIVSALLWTWLYFISFVD